MKPDLVCALQGEYPHYWAPELARLPDGWEMPLVTLFDSLLRLNSIDATSDRFVAAVRLRFDIQQTSASAFATPTMHVRWWTPARSQALIVALDSFHAATRSTCSRCGSNDAMLRTRWLGDDQEAILCDECTEKSHG